MKRCLSLLLVVTLLMCGCTQKTSVTSETLGTSQENRIVEDSTTIGDITSTKDAQNSATFTETENGYSSELPDGKQGDTQSYVYSPEFINLNDENLLRYVEDDIYLELVSSLNSSDYYVENVQAVYVSKEYLEELEYNSRSNIFFGYSLADIQQAYGDKKFVFTLGDNGNTIVKPFEDYDDTWDRVVNNILIGSGVILICVTVSVVSGGVGAPAVSLIFAASAKTGTVMALSSGALGGVASGIVTGIQTGDMNEAIKAAALAGSESFKWGAITGAIAGGVSEAVALKGATLNGLTMNEAATIQKESKYPLDVIKQFKSMEEYNVYKEAGLTAQMVDGKIALVQNIDLNYKSVLPDGREVTNLQRMIEGYAPLDPLTGKAYQLHHIGQKANGTLAVLTEAQHQGNSAILNTIGKESEINRAAFDKIREAFWKDAARLFQQGL